MQEGIAPTPPGPLSSTSQPGAVGRAENQIRALGQGLGTLDKLPVSGSQFPT